MARKRKLINHTGGNKKIIINLEIAEAVLEPELLAQLNHILVELNDLQETKVDWLKL